MSLIDIFYTACELESYNQISMCCVEVAVVSAEVVLL